MVGELSLMASAAAAPFTPGGIFHHHDQTLLMPPKDLQALLPGHGKRQDIRRSGGMQIGAPHLEDPWRFTSLLSESNNQLYMGDPMIKEHVLIDMQEARPEAMLFSYGVAEHCTRHKKILEFLKSGSSIPEDKDISFISDLMGFHTISMDMSTQPHVPMDAKFSLYDVGMDDPEQFLHPQRQVYASKSLLEFVGNLAGTSTITVHPNSNVLFSGNGSEMKDILSIVEEFNLSKKLSSGNKKAMVVPYFTWRRGGYAQTNTKESFSKLKRPTDAPSKSSGRSKLKTVPKKKQNRKSDRERGMYSKNYFHACESLLDVYLDKKGDSMVILSLKNSGPELTEVLHQLSAGIAGTGLAVLFSVACESVNGRALSLSSAKLLNISFGFGLFWLSWAVNRLQDTISNFSKKSNRGRRPNGEVTTITREVEKSINDVLFRAAALMAVALLRLL
ncbi:uncharacterized protein M6B38_191410 [Iris pallida]|uniref:Uncharacterized protein n=1 Tax=Iris pallida TaxID=29817 RepID=A0AAX6EFQ1_IRIPA|nr:uncharacterized protein M6B38_191410 [Iris pallida]